MKKFKEGDELICVKNYCDWVLIGEIGKVVSYNSIFNDGRNGWLLFSPTNNNRGFFIYQYTPGMQDLSNHFDFSPNHKFNEKLHKIIEE